MPTAGLGSQSVAFTDRLDEAPRVGRIAERRFVEDTSQIVFRVWSRCVGSMMNYQTATP